uniref:Arginase n=1 Tax=Sinohyriopsis cumingii TaxID=165450 RepID=D2KN89_SINCU|nr:arginase [Sinohyriopsis cumingii]
MPGSVEQMKMKSAERIGVLGIPFSKGQSRVGTEYGPEVLRNGGIVRKLQNLGCHVQDHGDVEVIQVEKDDPEENAKNPRTVGLTSKLIADKVERVLRSEDICLGLGGDHSVAIGTIAGNARVEPDLVVLWIDAHADINTPMTSDSGNIHGMPLAFLVRELESYVTKLPGFEWLSPCIHAKDIAYIGLRDVDAGERKIIEKFGITAFSMQEVDKYGINEVVERALRAVDPEGKRPIHLSFDVDAMDPTLATSARDHAVIGGLSLRETYYIAEEVARTGRLSMVDVAEVNPLLGDEKDKKLTVDMTISVIQRFFGNRRGGCYPPGYDIPLPHKLMTR